MLPLVLSSDSHVFEPSDGTDQIVETFNGR
jgi:hypothetical protein